MFFHADLYFSLASLTRYSVHFQISRGAEKKATFFLRFVSAFSRPTVPTPNFHAVQGFDEECSFKYQRALRTCRRPGQAQEAQWRNQANQVHWCRSCTAYCWGEVYWDQGSFHRRRSSEVSWGCLSSLVQWISGKGE